MSDMEPRLEIEYLLESRKAYKIAWPKYCRECDGWGGHAYWDSFEYCHDVKECSACLGKCPRCGEDKPEWDDSCEACGWDLESGCPSSKCPECNIQPVDRFCLSCGWDSDWGVFVMQPVTVKNLIDEGKTSDEIKSILEQDAKIKEKREWLETQIDKIQREAEDKVQEVRQQLYDLTRDCPHYELEHYPDASGNNDSSYVCILCGKEARRKSGLGGIYAPKEKEDKQ